MSDDITQQPQDKIQMPADAGALPAKPPQEPSTTAQTQGQWSGAEQSQTQEYLNGWKRALADYDNLKRDIARQVTEMREWQTISFFEELLPMVDLYETALQHVPDSEKNSPWFEGFRHIHSQLQQFIKDHNIVKMEVGTSFDPKEHEAVETQSDTARADGEILTIVSPGYRFNAKLLRPAKVIVNKLTN